MDDKLISAVLHNLLGLSTLAILYRCYCAYKTDALRESLFSLRDELFAYADSGGISFSHPAYRLLRGRMNTMIRFAHKVTGMRFLLSYFSPNIDVPHAFEQALLDMSISERQVMLDFRQRFAGVMLRHLWASPFFLLLQFYWTLFGGNTRNEDDQTATRLRLLELQAESEEKSNEELAALAI